MGTRALDEVSDRDHGRATLAALQQIEGAGLAVPVRVRDAVRVQQLPTNAGPSRNLQVGPVDPVKILNADPRRSSATVIATGDAIFIGPDPGAVAGGLAARWPVAVPLTIRSQDAWYVRAETETKTATVSVIIDQWAE